MKDQPGNPQLSESVLCIGNSMQPTLQVLDALIVLPRPGRKLRPGDVILFNAPDGFQVTHRVLRITREGILTMGDNNDRIDGWSLREKDVRGVVAGVWRKGKKLKVHGGIAGQVVGAKCRAIFLFKRGVTFVLRPLYNLASRSGIFRLWLPAGWKPRVLSFDRSGKADMQLLMGRRVIGLYNHEKKCWLIRPPYELFVDESTLPVKK